jgi:hypothetical protein
MQAMPRATSIHCRSCERNSSCDATLAGRPSRAPPSDRPAENPGFHLAGALSATLFLALLVAAITLALLDDRGRLCASVGRQGTAYVIALLELAALASTDVPFVAFVRLDQLAWHPTLLWKFPAVMPEGSGVLEGMGDIEDARVSQGSRGFRVPSVQD